MKQYTNSSCADLIRASIELRKMHLAKMMDCRVKPGNDGNQDIMTQAWKPQ
jgi:hypothetical protein